MPYSPLFDKMRMDISNLLLAVLTAVLICGCERPGTVEADASAIVVSINGADVSYKSFNQIIDLEAEVKFIGGQFSKGEAEKNAYRKIRRSEFLPQLVSCELIRQEFCRCGLKLPEGTVAGKVNEINAALGNGFSLYALAEKMQISRELVDWWLLLGAYEQPLLEKLYPDLLTIGTNDLRIVRQRMKDGNVQAAASNAVLKTSAERVLAQAKKGRPLTEIAKEEPWLDGSDAEYWTNFAKSEIEVETLRNWAFAAKPGEVGGPFDLPEGLVVAKVLEVQDGADDASVEAAPVRQVKLARLVIPQVELYPEIGDAELLEAIHTARVKESRVEVLKRLTENAKITYPMDEKNLTKTTK